eukprot:5501422-Amphidinium_carterae.2
MDSQAQQVRSLKDKSYNCKPKNAMLLESKSDWSDADNMLHRVLLQSGCMLWMLRDEVLALRHYTMG